MRQFSENKYFSPIKFKMKNGWDIKLEFFLILVFASFSGGSLPCNYKDAVDLSNTHKFQNGSYLFDGVLIPKNLTEEERSNGKTIIRGCICMVKECIPWCCPFKNQTLIGGECIDQDLVDDVKEEIIIRKFDSTENITGSLSQHFYFQTEVIPCENMYPLNPNDYPDDEWHLFENGSVYQPYFDEYTHKNTYCFALESYSSNSTNFMISPYFCSEVPDNSRHVAYAITFLVSEPFMILTIIIYVVIPELRNLHGKSLVCYLSSLSVAYLIFSYTLLVEPQHNIGSCTTLGYIAYFCFLAAYFWLSVISFDLWWNFSGRKIHQSFNESQRFLCYSAYCWGLSAFFVTAAYIVQNSKSISESYKPGFGDKYCYLNAIDNYTAVIYLYGPLILIIGFNILMFTLTWLEIHRVKREMARIVAKEESRRNLKKDRTSFALFLRLFIIMGVTWIWEIVSYFAGREHQAYFYVTDFLNAMQGFLIFALFVLKKKILYLILKRYYESRGMNNYSHKYFRRTSSSSSNTVSMQLHSNTAIQKKPLNDPDFKC